MAGREKDRPAADEGEGFLGRWSRRKAEARTVEPTAAVDPAAPDPAPGDEPMPAAATTGEPPAPDAPEFDIGSLPDIDSLGPKSDFRVFLQEGVPPELKTRALRKLWRVKADLANLDGLIDYGEDLTGSFKAVDHLKTAYEVGRGFLRDETDDAAADGKTADRHAETDEHAQEEAEPSAADPPDDAAETRIEDVGKAEKRES